MERAQAIVIAVVVAALALFGLKLWSDQGADSSLEPGRRAAVERLARAGGLRNDSDAWSESDSTDSSGGRPGRPGSSLRSGGDGGRGGSGADRRGGGSTEMARAGGVRGGGTLGYSGSGRPSGGSGSGADLVGGESGGRFAPKVQQKDDLVEFLGSQPPTQADLASPNGEDVALKIDKPEDIAKQGGQEQNVEEADDGDGIKITEATNIKFPNNVNPDGFTISFKISPEWSGSDPTDNALLEMRGPNEWANRIELVKNGEFLRFIVTTDSGREADISVRITDWPANQERELQAQVNMLELKSRLYMDGRLAGSQELTGGLQLPESILVGADHPGSSYGPAQSTIRGFQITNSANGG